MTPLRGGPLPISSRVVEMVYTGLQSCVVGRDVRHKAINEVSLCGQLGSYIYLLVLNNIRVCRGLPNLEINACRLEGAQCLPGLVCQGPDILWAL